MANLLHSAKLMVATGAASEITLDQLIERNSRRGQMQNFGPHTGTAQRFMGCNPGSSQDVDGCRHLDRRKYLVIERRTEVKGREAVHGAVLLNRSAGRDQRTTTARIQRCRDALHES